MLRRRLYELRPGSRLAVRTYKPHAEWAAGLQGERLRGVKSNVMKGEPPAFAGLDPAAKRSLLAELLARRPVARETFPLSMAQQRLWLIDCLSAPGAGATYNHVRAWHVRGVLDRAALQTAVDALVARHESLRTTFDVVDDAPIQRVAAHLAIRIVQHDLRALPAATRTVELRRLVRAESDESFDIRSGPLVRVTTISTSDDAHVLVLSIHHLVTDAWSCGIFDRELAEFYHASRRGIESRIQNVPAPYGDFAIEQQRWRRSAAYVDELAYWHQRLDGAPPLLDLTPHRPRPDIQNTAGSGHTFLITGPAFEALRGLGRTTGATLFMTLLAAFDVLVFRYTGRADVVIGVPVSNRSAPFDGSIGFFVNTLVLRSHVRGDASFVDYVREVRDIALGAYEHPNLPFEALVRECNPERRTSYAPLVQVMFSLLEATGDALEFDGAFVEPLEIERTTAKFDLSLECEPVADGLRCTFEYRTELFAAATIERLARSFRTLVDSIVDNPDVPISRLTIVPADEYERSVVTWNATDAAYPRDGLLHELFERQALQRPGHVAVSIGDESISYGTLDARANALAHYLRDCGVGPETLVGILLERSIDMVVGVLGILKSGGAYVPLDPEDPPERIALALADAGIDVFVIQDALRAKLPLPLRPSALALDTQWSSVAGRPTSAPPRGRPEDLAYVLHTSGSTGRPKGVMIEHRSVVNHLYAVRDAYGRTAADRTLQFAPLAFDMSVLQMFSSLASGGTLVLRTADMLDSPVRFLAACEKRGVTSMDLPTAFWQEVALAILRDEAYLPACVRFISIGGEAGSSGLVRAWQDRFGRSVRMLHGYGPTEATINASVYPLPCVPNEADLRRLSIGRPIANTQAYVLDAQLQPVPIGVAGELYLGGAGIARGYLNRPDLTAERFVADPFRPQSGGRLYRTGDLACFRSDANMEYLGRIDRQVKLRGFRIELGEVEAALLRHPAITAAVVVARDTLVAYVVRAPEDETDAANFRAFLSHTLPAHMLPSSIVTLDAIPLNPNGKIDETALPLPHAGLDASVAYRAPATSHERTLATIWCELLELERVGTDRNFFELGGHSLLVMRLISRLQAALGIDLQPRVIFECPTIAELGAHVDGTERYDESAPIVALPRRNWPRPSS